MDHVDDAAESCCRKLRDSFMEYKTARVAVFRSKSLGYIRLAALVVIVIFVFLRILLNNSYMDSELPLFTATLHTKDDYFFWPGIIGRFPLPTDTFCDSLTAGETFALPGSTRHMAAGRLLTATHGSCMSADDSGDKIFSSDDGMLPTAEVTYALADGDVIRPNVSFTRLDLDRTVVQLKFAANSETVRDKSDDRFHANDETADVRLLGQDGSVLQTCFDRSFLASSNTSRKATTPVKPCVFTQAEPVYLNLRSVLRAAGVNLEDTNAEYKEDTARIEADKVGVPEADRIASTLSYPYRLSGMVLRVTVHVSNFDSDDMFSMAPRNMKADITISVGKRGHTMLSEHLDLHHPHSQSVYHETYGMWIVVFHDGELHHFSIVNLLLTLASGVAVLVVVRIATDFYALTLHPQRSEMRRLKEERMDGKTTNVVDLEDALTLVVQHLTGEKIDLGRHNSVNRLAAKFGIEFKSRHAPQMDAAALQKLLAEDVGMEFKAAPGDSATAGGADPESQGLRERAVGPSSARPKLNQESERSFVKRITTTNGDGSGVA